MSAAVRLILFDLRKHPIAIARGYLAAAEFANAGSINPQGRPAIGTVQIRARRPGIGSAISYERPILAPATQSGFRPADHAATAVDCVIKAFRPNARRNSIVKSVFLNLHWLHCCDLALVERVAQPLPAIGI